MVAGLCLSFVFSGCNGDVPPPGIWDTSTADVTCETPATEQARAVAVDLYLDATSSMEGYAQQGGVYGRFLDALASSITAGWAEADVRFYRFGTRVDSIGPDAFRAARTDPAFYRQSGIFETTNIDSVLARTDPDRVSVVVTDLFQSDGDMNALVQHIKDRAFARGLDVAVLGLASEFDGRVFDAPGGTYQYASTEGDASTFRPFYALMFGSPANIARLFDTLRSKDFVDAERFTVVSPCVVDGFEVALAKTRESTDLVLGSAGEGNQFRFNLREGGDGGTLTGTVVVEPDPFAPAVNAERVELVAFRKPVGGSDAGADSVRVEDFTFREARWSGDTLHVTMDYRTDVEPGTYSYFLQLRAGSVDGLRTPAWVAEWSSDNPTAASDANRTLNLTPLVENLLQARTTLRQPLLAKFFVTVRRL